jgi:hypothetical protein
MSSRKCKKKFWWKISERVHLHPRTSFKLTKVMLHLHYPEKPDIQHLVSGLLCIISALISILLEWTPVGDYTSEYI